MAFTLNGVDCTEVQLNGTAMDSVQLNGTEVFTSFAGTHTITPSGGGTSSTISPNSSYDSITIYSFYASSNNVVFLNTSDFQRFEGTYVSLASGTIVFISQAVGNVTNAELAALFYADVPFDVIFQGDYSGPLE